MKDYHTNGTQLGLSVNSWQEIRDGIPFTVGRIDELSTNQYLQVKVQFGGMINQKQASFSITIPDRIIGRNEEELREEIIREIKNTNFDEVVKEII